MRLPILPMVIIIAIAVIIDIYITRCLSRRLRNPWWARVYAILAVIINCALIVIIALPRRSGSDSQLLVVMWGLYAYLSVYISKLAFIILDLLAKIPVLWKGKRLKWLSRGGVALSFLILAIMGWGSFINRFDIQVKEVAVEIQGLPEAFDGYRIAQLSDIHLGTYGTDTTFIDSVVRRVNALHPDLIVFTGDIVNRHEPEAEPFVSTLSRLVAADGVKAVLGNHDYGDYYDWPDAKSKEADRKATINLFKRMGWRLLLNENCIIRRGNDSIAIIGVENVGDPPFKVYGDLDVAYPDLNDSVTKILLSHTPYHWTAEVADHPDKNIALTLAGHTHAMQIEIGGWSPAKWRYDTWGGLYSDSCHHQLYVNIGLGEVAIPMRIGANPEITLITLKNAP